MKNLKQIVFAGILSVLLSCFFMSVAHAAKRAIFPDPNTLQPIPTTVHPNISGNINSQGIPSEQNQSVSGQTGNGTGNSATDGSQNSSGGVSYFFWSMLAVAGLILVVLIVWILKKVYKKL